LTPATRVMRSPVAIEPVKQILRTRGSPPSVPPGPVRTDSTPLRQAGVDEAGGQRGQRGRAGGLEHDRVAGGQGGGELCGTSNAR
jgi:hypothetical protein